MKVILKCLILLVVISTCNAQEEDTPKIKPFNLNDYIPIKDGLHKDKDGNLYFKVIDGTEFEYYEIPFISSVWSDTFVDAVKDMKYVVDSGSFQMLTKNRYYKDKNHVYVIHTMMDGGTMAIVEEADAKTFKTWKGSAYGVDNTSVFYKGEKFKVSDLATFEPVFIKETGVGWYAKDKRNYYDGEKKMSAAEVKELKESIKEFKAKN